MMRRTNYYSGCMSDDYDKLMKLLDTGNVVVCFVDYVYDTGGKKTLYRDVAKVHSNNYSQISANYGYIVEARGIVYASWDRRMEKLRGVTFEGMCDDVNLQFIDIL